ncbi:MAG: nucleoside-diphosphate kinase [Chloroflexota bacterium]|nr:nucleoside-diphosphate kinase [Chloroflexota bacterium]
MEAEVQRTLVLVKPDGVRRGLVGEIIGRFERKGLRLVEMRLLDVPDALASAHYAVHRERPFYGELVAFITSGPVVALAVEGPDAIAVIRTLIGSTRPAAAAPGTIRGDLGLTTLHNLVHASDGPETALEELALWFGESASRGYGTPAAGTSDRSEAGPAAASPSSSP